MYETPPPAPKPKLATFEDDEKANVMNFHIILPTVFQLEHIF